PDRLDPPGRWDDRGDPLLGDRIRHLRAAGSPWLAAARHLFGLVGVVDLGPLRSPRGTGLPSPLPGRSARLAALAPGPVAVLLGGRRDGGPDRTLARAPDQLPLCRQPAGDQRICGCPALRC